MTKDDFQQELERMRKEKKDEAKEAPVNDEDLQRELEWMRMERKGETKKPKAAPEQPQPESEQPEATDELRVELDELRRDQMMPVQQSAPEAKDPEQPEEGEGVAPEAGEEEERFYVVKRGDSLSKISEKVYGDASRWREIYRANKDIIENPKRIYPKQKLRIP